MRILSAFWKVCLVSLVMVGSGYAEDPSEVWITGEIFTSAETNGQLLFLADKPIKDNPARNVVLLGTTRPCANTFMPLYGRAVETHMKVRLFGVLQKITLPPNAPPTAPNVQFIAWKFHAASDPDELPTSEKMLVDSNTCVESYMILMNRPSDVNTKISDYSFLIEGRWQNMDANPTRLIYFNKDGNWSLHYSDGKTPDQKGTWQVNGTTLVRTYPTGFKRDSDILILNDSEMMLSNIVESPVGSIVQLAHYTRPLIPSKIPPIKPLNTTK